MTSIKRLQPMKGTVEINGLRLFARHGVYEEERVNGNTFELTIHLEYPMEKGLTDDDLAGTLNYAEVADVARRVMDEPSQLLEHVAWRLHNALTERFPLIKGGMIRLTKLNPPIPADMDGAAVRIEW